ncbi:type IV toxin-antitoxin system AbiEi family antitoxin domain-containing protein [Nocardia suismassiliense]|uniref:type IV toxin-antitoxin system AbiEi family antitoxin domain-containing protein n=1 Tax=Nocardia suismassiliense TaxID=2077092 RepID=UPI00131F2B12|nr:type IV toxin-antitoxin system AbiEi family antitoxin domain-containing protein [Nocardia suismassiliense]
MDAPQLISRRQALAAGMSDSQLQRLCRSGKWQRIRAGHYVNAPQPALTPAGRHLMLVLAMCEAMSDDAVASHCSALVLHGLPTWSLPLERAHVTRDRIAGGRIRKQLVLHSAQLTPDEITLINSVRVTTAPRTIFDIARSAGFEHAVVCGDSALRQGLTTADALGEHLQRASHRRGSRQAARAIEFLDGRSESVGESRSRVAFHESGLPAPELQARVLTDDEVCVGRVDFLFDGLGVIGEFEGQSEQRNELSGARLPAQWTVAAQDQDDQLRALGWEVVRWTWSDLDDPAQLAERIRAAAEVAGRAHRTGHWIPTPRS